MRQSTKRQSVLTETVLEVTNGIGNIFNINRNEPAIFLSDVRITCVADAFLKE